jgi:hypothetical protein
MDIQLIYSVAEKVAFIRLLEIGARAESDGEAGQKQGRFALPKMLMDGIPCKQLSGSWWGRASD